MAKWLYEKFKGDMAIYAICPKCNFIHNCGAVEVDGNIRVYENYAFCPFCGTFLYDEKTDLYGVDIPYNVRDMLELCNWKLNTEVIRHAIEKASQKDGAKTIKIGVARKGD